MGTKKVVGVFATEKEASRAIESLKQEGFRIEDISVVGKHKEQVEELNDQTKVKGLDGAAAGMTAGGVLGGVTGLMAGIGALAIPGIGPLLAAGPIVATLTGAAVGAGAGGLVGALVGMGLPEKEAKEYESYVDEGRVLVLVDTDDARSSRVHDIFRTHDTLNADRYGSPDRVSPGKANVDEGPVDHGATSINERNGTDMIGGAGAYPADDTSSVPNRFDGSDRYLEEDRRRERERQSVQAPHDPSEGSRR